ncbi:type VI secretion system amidase effector protein Tae4 [Ralstonia wenshanensis]|uniref:type VI secretion system amidase effector protein Tae4 n=1 Tax=Ralstonia wenshanensis TaxID=2842456 RepID=UPI0039C71787
MTAAQRKPLKQKAQVRTNATPGSVCRIDAPAVTFANLWGDYVTGSPYKENGEVPPNFKNQCAIRLSVTLHKVGIEMKSFTSANVTVKPGSKFGRILMDGRHTAVLADQMGSWLSRQPFCGLRKTENITGKDWESKIKGRTGIVMFDSYWSRRSDSAGDASGGHIDLWNGSRLTISGPINSIATVGRMFGMNSLFPGSSLGFSDLRDSKRILFWEVK